MKLLLASEYFYPHWTGIAKAFLILAKDLQKKGHDITLLTTQFEKNLPRKEHFENIQIIRSPGQYKISRTNYSFTSLLEFAKLIINSDRVIINSPHSNILFFTLFAKFFGKKVYIFHQGDIMLPRKSGSIIINVAIEKIFDLLTIPAFFLANNVSTYTKDYAQNSRTMKYFLKKFFAYIPSTPLPNSSTILKEDTRDTNKILIGFAGRFVEEKGFDILYQAIDVVVKKMPNACFVFAGNTKMDYEPFYETQKKLFDAQKRHVSYLGLLDEKKLTKFYKSLDVFVISSRSDCFPLTQIEAAQYGIPLVCTNIPGARMLVKETNVGVIVPPNDATALANGIIDVIKNRKKYAANKKNVATFLKKYETFTLN